MVGLSPAIIPGQTLNFEYSTYLSGSNNDYGNGKHRVGSSNKKRITNRRISNVEVKDYFGIQVR